MTFFFFKSWIDLFIFWQFCFEVALPSRAQQMFSGITVTFFALNSEHWFLPRAARVCTLIVQEAESNVMGRKGSMQAVYG